MRLRLMKLPKKIWKSIAAPSTPEQKLKNKGPFLLSSHRIKILHWPNFISEYLHRTNKLITLSLIFHTAKIMKGYDPQSPTPKIKIKV